MNRGRFARPQELVAENARFTDVASTAYSTDQKHQEEERENNQRLQQLLRRHRRRSKRRHLLPRNGTLSVSDRFGSLRSRDREREYQPRMSETKDMAIKLFGKTIPLSQNEEIPAASVDSGGTAGCVDQDCVDWQEKEFSKEVEKEQTEEKDHPLSSIPTETKENQEEEAVNMISEEVKKDAVTAPSAIINDNPKTPSVEKETSTLKTSKTEEENSDTSVSQEKTLKKPDKILPCPRCNSMDTKFCYYNNYNVNQPRHFCKNCQRYWTAGGTMRNVPVGAGRRKNKNSSSHYRHITVSEALQTARANVLPDGIHHTGLRQGSTVLTFGSDTPLCESVASVLNIAEKSKTGTRNGFHRPEELRIPDSGGGGGENGDETGSNKPSVGAPNPTKPHVLPQNCNGFPPQIPCFPGAPWAAYPWNSSQWSSSVPAPAFCSSSFPIPFYHTAAYWGCAVPGTWTFPWPTTPPLSSSLTNTPAAPGSGPNSPLGKHSREGDMFKLSNSEKEEQGKESDSERCLWIPKTLRIDDPGEAARSSIWATLGINKNDKADLLTGGRLFKAFRSKVNEKTPPMVESSPVLQANPAALSRSLNFQESS